MSYISIHASIQLSSMMHPTLDILSPGVLREHIDFLSVSRITLCKNVNSSKSWPQSGTHRNFGILVKCTFQLTFF